MKTLFVTAICMALSLSACVRFGWDRAVQPGDGATAEDGSPAMEQKSEQGTPTTDAGEDAGAMDSTADRPRSDALIDTGNPDTTEDTLAPDTTRDTLAPDTTRDTLAPDAEVNVPGTWVQISAGSFNMGSSLTEACRWDDEALHLVTLTQAFEIQTTEVTQSQYQSVMGSNPSSNTDCGADCPVESVTWHMAAAYCNALSALKNHTPCYSCAGSGYSTSCALQATYAQSEVYLCPGYRLPTEAEWEYAYRAGTSAAYYSGPADANACGRCREDANANAIGWNCSNTTTIQPVAQKIANAWGLYDMAANVWEWTQDWYTADLGGDATNPWGAASGDERVTRGGSYDRFPDRSRAAFRGTDPALAIWANLGVRCVRSLP